MDKSQISANSAATLAVTAASSAVTTRTYPQGPDMLDCFRDPRVCDILPTSGSPQPDTFAAFRPKPRTVLDYKISQTDIKSQVKQRYGITKLHVQDTSASYQLPPPGYVFPEPPAPPAPPPEPVIQYSTGGPPLEEFLDDIWMRKVEKKQIEAKKRLRKLIRRIRKEDKEKLAKEHEDMIKLVGPAWFQELSPQQLTTVDNLKTAIVKDVKIKSTCNTEINMAQLGLVLRPNPKHIQIALKKCCECPVEFLLILYQLLNKHRTDYSLNDRLLLSAVVHLTMRETLKELHIRIPSPPPKPKKVKKQKKKKLPRYTNPYLEPFTFVPEKPKHSGIYKNSHIQYPESPYFSYISELKAEMEKYQNEEVEEVDDEELDEEEEEDEEEEKPTKIIVTKKQSGITDLQEEELVGELRVAQREYNKLVNYEPVAFLHKPSIYIPCDHCLKKKKEESLDNATITTATVEVTVTDCDAECVPFSNTCACRITFDASKVPKHPVLDEDNYSSCGCGSSAVSETGEKVEEGEWEKPVATKTIAVSTASRDDIKIEIIEVTKRASENAQQSPEEAPDEKIIKEKLITLGQRDSSECKCKEEVEKTLETRICQCEMCVADREEMEKHQKQTFIISGMSETRFHGQEEGEDEIENEIHVVPIIGGVKLKKTCDCLEKYQAKVKMYEQMKKSFDVQHTLMTTEQQFIIGGLTYSHDGEPVYMLSGVTPDRQCGCAKIYQEKLKEQERLANMPKIPLGRQKYVISGVHPTNEGNVFVVSGAAAVEDCSCMKMYKSYENKHLPCLQMYEEYLKKIEVDTQEYMEDIAADPRGFEEPIDPTFDDWDDVAEPTESTEEMVEPEASSEQRVSIGSAKSPRISEENVKPRGSNGSTASPRQIVSPTGQDCPCGGGIKETNNTNNVCGCDDDNNEKKSSKKNKGKHVCICNPANYTCVCDKPNPADCECGSKEEPLLRRFVIMNKIPCKRLEQIEIIQKALEILAEDGFPLAKLPESYKLPLFKLWMQLRCGKFWTQEDRVPMLMTSAARWRHLAACNIKVRLPKLNLTPSEMHSFTWADATSVRQMTTDADVLFYRQVRQKIINDGREFFPSTDSYELPTHSFRDCYFAYTPGKEEDCHCWKPWYSREFRKKKKAC